MVGLLQVLRKVTVSIRAVGVGTSGSSLSLSNQISCDARAVVSEWQCSPIPRLISRGSSSSVATHRTEVAMAVWQVDGLNILLSCWQKPLSLIMFSIALSEEDPFRLKSQMKFCAVEDCTDYRVFYQYLHLICSNNLQLERLVVWSLYRLLETYVELKDATL